MKLRSDVLHNARGVPPEMDTLSEKQNDPPQELPFAGDHPSDSLDVSLSQCTPRESKICVDDDISIVQEQCISLTVQTRASKKKEERIVELKRPVIDDLDMNKEDFCNAQNTCPTLKVIREKVKTGNVESVKSRSVKFELRNGLIYRVCIDSKHEEEIGNEQLVVPETYREKVLNVAHDSLSAGHFSHRKTSYKVFQRFFGPGAGEYIKRYCRSYHKCQKVTANSNVGKVPMNYVPVISEQFSRVAIDLVGPLYPCSARGHRYI